MKEMKIYHLLIIAGMVLLASCAKLPVYESKVCTQNATENFPELIANNYDENDNVKYGFANDSKDFYIQAIFQDRESFRSIMQGGLIIYFDPNGKKGKDYQLKIERTQQQNDMMRLSVQEANPNNGERQRPGMNSTISMALTKVTWDKNGKEFVFYRNLIKEPIFVDLSPTENEQLVLSVKMPLNEIPLQDNSSVFSVGIVSGKNTDTRMSGNRPSGRGGMQGGGGMGGPGGGGGMRGSGMGGSGGGRMGGGGGRPQGSQESFSSSPIDIWCIVKL